MTLFLALLASTQAAEETLVIANSGAERRFTAAELSARPDAAALSVTGDVYHHAVTYRAVPLLSLLGGNPGDRFDTVEAQARDGFVSQIPLALIAGGEHGGAVAFIAVEDLAHPWPPLPQKTETAGPFYLVWEHPEKSGITREQWPYQLVRLSFVESPVHRWPQLSAPGDVPVGAPARHGQDVFITQCLPCHRLNGGGASDTGPDLGRPMNPTQYLADAGLRAIIRNPQAVRTWPNQQMIGFGERVLSDADLDALVAYLRAMASSNQ
jgi:mono/diheme cytochrome c family protein